MSAFDLSDEAAARRALDAVKEGAAAWKARAEKAERERDALYDASRLTTTGMEVVRAAVRLAHDPDARILLKANIEAAKRAEAGEAKLAALESRLAEQAPVVEAVLGMDPGEFFWGQTKLRKAVAALRAARSLRGAGGGGGA